VEEGSLRIMDLKVKKVKYEDYKMDGRGAFRRCRMPEYFRCIIMIVIVIFITVFITRLLN